jgi:peptidoglycan/xylan/chitin deacetylase (PgdA/CDA1 family)
MQSNKRGAFIISLDFELFWGVHDVYKKEEYEQNVRGAHKVVLSLLEMFQLYQIHATWAIVGMIYFKNIEELQSLVPEHKPGYDHPKLSSYHYMENNPITPDDLDLFFAPYLIESISSTSNQEVATHTFSHYYCLEHGQTLEQFSADLQLAQQISRKHGSEIKSIVFPRNQINEEYIRECKRLGLVSYRGNEDSWVYRLESQEKKRYVKRGLRLLDRYINIFGHQAFDLPAPSVNLPLNIKSSRYLARCSERLKPLEGLRLKRILNDMTYAAKHGKAYHLWWHPHDFGVNTAENLRFLEKILAHYLHLQDNYGFKSRNMSDLALEICSKKEG